MQQGKGRVDHRLKETDIAEPQRAAVIKKFSRSALKILSQKKRKKGETNKIKTHDTYCTKHNLTAAAKGKAEKQENPGKAAIAAKIKIAASH